MSSPSPQPQPSSATRLVCFPFSGLHGRPGLCDIELIPISDGRTLVVCTERDDNPGASVTNAAELIATQVCRRFGIDPAVLVWIEHYPPGRAHGRTPDWDLVTFHVVRHGKHWHLGEPDWRPMRPDDWRNLGLSPRNQHDR